MGNRKETVGNFFHEKYSRKEYFSVQSEFEKEKTDEDFLTELEQQWQSIKDDTADGFHKQTIWNRIVSRLELKHVEKVKTLGVFDWLQRVAAVLFIPLIISFAVYFYVTNSIGEEIAWAEIVCPSGVRTEFKLPDGSTGVLNSESTLRYASNFHSNRTVKLQGQAYFDVVKDKRHPFDVVTNQIRVQVLGTSFSVKAYPDQDDQDVVLKTGKVKVSTADQKTLAMLSPNQQFVLDKVKNKYYTTNVNATALTSWIDGKLVIQNERFEEVAQRLSRWYHVQIEIEDQKLKDYKYYGTFENETIEEVLRLIALTAPIKYKEVERVKYPDGTFSNRKIKLTIDEKRVRDFN